MSVLSAIRPLTLRHARSSLFAATRLLPSGRLALHLHPGPFRLGPSIPAALGGSNHARALTPTSTSPGASNARRVMTSAAPRGLIASRENIDPRAREVLLYWLGEGLLGEEDGYWPEGETEGFKKWFMGGKKVDDEIISNFSEDLVKAAAGEYDTWLSTAYGKLALVILCDQFTRNAYRGTPKMYATDSKALGIVRMIHGSESDMAVLRPVEKNFLLLPLMHDEDLMSQDECIRRAKEMVAEMEGVPGFETAAKSCGITVNAGVDHRVPIEKFGRFPSRNAILGRESTPEEKTFLETHKGW